MNYRAVASYIGHLLRLEGVFMIPALCIALLEREHKTIIAFAATILIVVAAGCVMLFFKPKEKTLYSREGFLIVSLSWVFMSLFGALPFFISREIPSFIDAFFETVSGFTTTGASILANVEVMSASLLYWRSFTHWLGGMGVLVFILAIMPTNDMFGGSLRIMRAESPGPVVGKLVPKLRYTARLLYIIYVAMTIIEIGMLLLGGMPLFDSIIHTFGTAGTGGFSMKALSMGAYESYYLQTVVSVFMLLFGVNFNIYYLLLIRDFKSVAKNQEIRLYFGIVAFAVITIALNIYKIYGNVFDALHHSLFQVSSIITTTGFSTADFNAWPEYSRCLLVMLMIVGACAGSTGGGIKVVRLLMLLKSLRNSIQKMIHPRSVKLVKLDGKVVDKNTLDEVSVFITVYMVITAVSIMLISMDDCDFDTNISGVLACINNIGPGLSVVGPMGNFASFSVLSKLVLIADMLFGRLEIFPLLLIFTPSMWKRYR